MHSAAETPATVPATMEPPVGAGFLDLHIRAKRFGDTEVLRDVRVRAAAGEIVVLVGASGCGKSTLLRIVAGLDPDYLGSVTLAGRPLHGVTREIGFIFQEPRLFPWLSVAANVAFDRGRTASDDPQAARLLAEVGLSGLGDALPRRLSGGQAQRVAIARGLHTQPRLLLLDEPFSAVDAFTRFKLQELIVAVAAAHGITLLLVTHDIDEAVFLGDRVLVMDAHPGTVVLEVAVGARRPRDRGDPARYDLRQEVFAALHAVHAL